MIILTETVLNQFLYIVQILFFKKETPMFYLPRTVITLGNIEFLTEMVIKFMEQLLKLQASYT